MIKNIFYLFACLFVLGCETGNEPVTINATCTIRRSGNDILADVSLKNTGNRKVPSAGTLCAGIRWAERSMTLYGDSGTICIDSMEADSTVDLGEKKINIGNAIGLTAGTSLTCMVYNYSDGRVVCPTTGTCSSDTDPDLTIKNDTSTLIVP